MGATPAGSANLSWNLAHDIEQLFAYHFMVNALAAATITAVVAGVAGWFMVLRRQTFAGHTLSVVSFPGAAAATWLGISVLWGYFGFCCTAAAIISLVPYSADRRGFSEEPAVIGVLQAFALGCGFLFVSLYKGFLNGLDALLFGTFLGVTDTQLLALAGVAAAAVAALAVLGRPLLLASVDPAVAAAEGVPVRLVSSLFLVVLGAAVAEVSQITGALLVFALLVMPAAAAQRLSARPAAGLALSVAIGLGVAWLGLGASYFFPAYPAGFFITTVGFASYLLARGWQLGRRHVSPRPAPALAAPR